MLQYVSLHTENAVLKSLNNFCRRGGRKYNDSPPNPKSFWKRIFVLETFILSCSFQIVHFLQIVQKKFERTVLTDIFGFLWLRTELSLKSEKKFGQILKKLKKNRLFSNKNIHQKVVLSTSRGRFRQNW